MEKRGYIDSDWTPDKDQDEKQAEAGSKSVEQLDDDLSKRLANAVACKCDCRKSCDK